MLTDPDGTMRPIQWTGYVPRMKGYQGELVGKDEIVQRFERKVVEAIANPQSVTHQDWSGLDAVFDAVRRRLAAM